MANKNNIYLGTFLLGTTGVLIGVVVHSPFLAMVAGALGATVGSLIGWLGGRRYLIIICIGVLLGAFFGYQSGDQDILIMAAGTGGAISGFFANQLELFLKK